MTKYSVDIPIAGYIYAEIEANSKEEAKEKAFELDWNIDFKSKDGASLEELDVYDKIIEGNICHLWCREIDINEIEDEE